jgi:hypothetical protein
MPEKPDPNKFSSGQSDSMEPGESNYDWSPTVQSGWYIEHNLNERNLQTGGGATYDIKVGGTVARYNTIRNSGSPAIDLRFGAGSTIESNWFDTGGITVHGADNKILCNRLGDGFLGIRLIAGDQPYNDGSINKHPAVYNTLVAKNTGALKVGHQYKAD